MTALEQARAVADAVLYEGYLLFPYTRSALKNQSRFQFGVLMPQGYTDTSEPSFMEFTVLVSPRRGSAALRQAQDDDITITITARFLHLDTEEGTEREVPLQFSLREGGRAQPFTFDDLRGTVACSAQSDGDYVRVAVRMQNDTRIAPTSDRNAALGHSLVGAHALAEISNGAFISLLDPPDDAKDAASRCKNRRVYPVLTGEPGANRQTASMLLASPIILYDFPQVAAQSTAHTFDATEIDELLLLSVASMSDEEKREAREGNARARAIVDRADASCHPELVEGTRVVIHPKRRADAFDMFADGQIARVKAVHEDLDGRRYVSVIFEDDPASDMHEWYGRSFFYEPDEVEVLR